MSNLTETQINRREIYDGSILHVFVDTVRLPNGEKATRELCEHVGAVAIVALTDDGRVIMERQYRYPHGRVFFEIPAGKLNYKTEDVYSAAARELREETGAVAREMTYLGEIATTPALMDERIHIFLARGITFGDRSLDEDEFIDVELAPLPELVELVMNGEIRDAKTATAILKVARIEGV